MSAISVSGLEEQQLGVLAQRVLPRGDAGAGNECGLDAEFGHDVGKQLQRRAEHAGRAEHVVARLEQCHGHRQNSGHARGGGDAGLCAFQGREAFLKCAHRGIGEARIDIALRTAGEARRRLGSVFEYEARGEIHRLGMFAELAAVNAGAHREGIEFDFICHDCVRIESKKPAQLRLRRVSHALAVFVCRSVDREPAAPASYASNRRSTTLLP